MLDEGICPRCLAAANFATGSLLTGAGTSLPPPPIEEIAPHFPQLEILACLGRGGMGVVYQARQKSLDRLVALKLLAPEREKDPQFSDRFAKEALALAKLSHPHIVTVHDFGQAGGFFYLLMEFVGGVNLRQLLTSHKLTPAQALAVVPPLCDALQYAHDRGIVHRDIKPENLLMDREGKIKVADFGLAKMLGDDAMLDEQPVGTPSYMAPEQTNNPAQVDSRADIYSLGVVFYEMLTGELPAQQLQPPSRKVQIDVRLDEVVLRALEKEPSLRWQQASVLKTEVEAIASTTGSSSTGPKTPPSEPSKAGLTWFPLGEYRAGRFRLFWSRIVLFYLGGAGLTLLFGNTIAVLAHREFSASDSLFWALLCPLWATSSLIFSSRKMARTSEPVEAAISRPGDDRAWLSRCALLVFLGSLILPPILYLIARDQPRWGDLVGISAVVGLVVSFILGVLTWKHLPGRIVAIAVPVVALLLTGVSFYKKQETQQLAQKTRNQVEQHLKAARASHRKEGQGELEPILAAWKQPDKPAALRLFLEADWSEGAFFASESVMSLSEDEFKALPPEKREAASKEIGEKIEAMRQLSAGVVQAGLDAAASADPVLARKSFAAVKNCGKALSQSGALLVVQLLGQGMEHQVEAAPVAIQEWLLTLDEGNYAKSWQAASEGFQKAVTQAQWVAKSEEIRRPLGRLISRKPTATQKLSQLPGMPDGSYFVAEFSTAFDALPVATETVTFTLEKDGQWRPSSYVILPRTAGDAEPIAAAEKWLTGIDSGHYAESWKNAAAVFQQAITEAGWQSALAQVRQPLGALVSRKIRSTRLETSLPGVPDGQYLVMQFDTVFASKKSAVETVTFQKETDGQWRSTGYFIR